MIDWIAKGVAIFAIGFFALALPLFGVGWVVAKIFGLNADDEVFTRVVVIASMALAGSLVWKIGGHIKQEKIDQTQKFLDDWRGEANRLQRRVEELEK